jgi:hypothetical protein
MKKYRKNKRSYKEEEYIENMKDKIGSSSKS